MIVHHQAIVVASVERTSDTIQCDDLRTFLSDTVRSIDMQSLFDPIALHGKFGFTGIVGIVTSHIAFHYFDSESVLHFDVYSCKAFDLRSLLRQIDAYWRCTTADVLFINRGDGLTVERYAYQHGEISLLSTTAQSPRD